MSVWPHLEHKPGDQDTAPSRSRSRWRWMVALFLLAFACELIVPAVEHYRKTGGWQPPGAEEPQIAAHLALGHGYRSPYDPSASAPPTSWDPPLYPAFLSIYYRCFGFAGHRLMVALALTHACFFGAVTVALFCLGELLWSRWAGAAAGIIHCIMPPFVHGAFDYWDAYMSLMLFAWVLVAVTWLRKRQVRLGLRHAAGVGVGMGILSLINASYVMALPVLIWVASCRRSAIQRLAFAAVAVGCFALVHTPWTVRNYLQFHRVFFVRDGMPFELWLWNQPICTGGFMREVAHNFEPQHNKHEKAKILDKGETIYFQECRKKFIALYKADPAAFWQRTLRREIFCFTGESIYPRPSNMGEVALTFSGILLRLLNALLCLLGLSGALLAWRRGCRCGWVLLAGYLLALPCTLSVVIDRYLLPFRMMLALFAAYFLTEAVPRLGSWVGGALRDFFSDGGGYPGV